MSFLSGFNLRAVSFRRKSVISSGYSLEKNLTFVFSYFIIKTRYESENLTEFKRDRHHITSIGMSTGRKPHEF